MTLFKYIYLSFLLFLPAQSLLSHSVNDSILAVLDQEIENREIYYKKKEDKISEFKEQLTHFSNASIKFEFCDKIYREYLPYQFDSAFVYANHSLMLAREMNNPEAEAIAGCNLLHCYISAGLFKESNDIMNSIDISEATNETKAWYYIISRRLFTDMGRYAAGTPFCHEYNRKAEAYCDSILKYVEPGSFQYVNTTNIKLLDEGVPHERLRLYNIMLNDYDADPGEMAKLTYGIGTLYDSLGDTDKAIYYLALSSIYDTRYSIRETLAKRDLAKILHKKGDVMRASNYIQVALEEANFYNARHRKVGINAVLPLVEKQRVEIIQEQKSKLKVSLIAVSCLFVLLAVALFVIYKQIKKLHRAKQSIQEQYNEISIINQRLEESNIKLEDTNRQLEESNEIKDQYIIQSIYGKSEYLDTVESILVKLDRKLKVRQYDDIYMLHKEFNIKSERENTFSSFDQAFLKLFPNFLEEYNRFFLPEDRTELDANGNLTPELRIFALIRLGVTESERIAKFLNLSVKTIYSYKGKVKAKAIIPKEEFEYRVMQIKKKSS